MHVSQILSGGILLLIGVLFLILSFFTNLVFLLYGFIAFGVGLAILLNKNADRIEKAKVRLK